ncbi:UNKNOWN [Stylonychia lemnae]|uniref:EF-hand domain-containing protein n=1 Tax=Stylonychia lemnae TaxID=5949 RepID=A0A078AAB8_STYLE|nr:UNKNOWN [Stylonychia lemnae]|eukprot:CDW79205.1 UNKNOWN [Stylonychia lemnae]
MFLDSNADEAGFQRDKAFDDKCAKNSLENVKGTKSTFRLYTQEGIICIATAAAGFNWEYQQQSEFWVLKALDKSLFGEKVYKCINVWWFNPKWVVEKIPPGIYHVYIRQGNSNIDPECRFSQFKGVGFKGKIVSVKFLKHYIPFRENQHRLINTYVATLDLSEVDELTNIQFELFRSDIRVSNYLIEGLILVPVQSLEQPPTFFLKLLTDDDLKEVKWELRVEEPQFVIPITNENVENFLQRQPTQKLDDMFAEESDSEVVERLKTTYQEIWEKYDINRNNYLDRQEFKNCMTDQFKKIKYPTDEKKLDQFFNKSDTYQTGQLTQQQMHWLLIQIVRIQIQLEEQEKKQEIIRKKEKELQAQNDNAKTLEDLFEKGKITIKGSLQVKSEGKSLPDNMHAVENLIQKEGKWRIEDCDKATIILKLEEEIEFMVVGVKSANDSSRLDPAMIEISILKEDQYEVIVSKDDLMFDQRFQNRLFKPNENGLMTKEIKINLQSRTENGLQLSEILLYNKVAA